MPHCSSKQKQQYLVDAAGGTMSTALAAGED